MVLFVVRTFLGALMRHDGTACCDAKIRKSKEILKIITFENSKSPTLKSLPRFGGEDVCIKHEKYYH